MSRLRLALLQMRSHGADQDANLRKGLDFCRRAAAGGADLALFPEMWNVGYQGFDVADPAARARWLAGALPADADFVARHRELARELGMAVALTLLEAGPGLPRNALQLIDRRGEVVLRYAKVHTCAFDQPEASCAPGEDFPVTALETSAGPVRVGAMICFDREFPESARLLMLGGAELILVPNACPLDDREAGLGDVRIAQFRGRAFENLVALAMTNYAAPQEDGRSLVCDALGRVVAQAGEGEELHFADLDLDALRETRRREAAREAQRKPWLYGAISEGRG